jgi:hypothetical protein
MTTIFESPDKGKTVYAREFGSKNETRRLVKSPSAVDDAAEAMRESAHNNKRNSNK